MKNGYMDEPLMLVMSATQSRKQMKSGMVVASEKAPPRRTRENLSGRPPPRAARAVGAAMYDASVVSHMAGVGLVRVEGQLEAYHLVFWK